jgi:hypothetical protein
MLVSWARGYLRTRLCSSLIARASILSAGAASILLVLPVCAFGQSYGVQIIGNVHLGTGGSGPFGFISCTLPYSECFDQSIAVPANGGFLQSVTPQTRLRAHNPKVVSSNLTPATIRAGKTKGPPEMLPGGRCSILVQIVREMSVFSLAKNEMTMELIRKRRVPN